MPLKVFADGENVLHHYAKYKGYLERLKDALNEATPEDIIRANQDGDNPFHIACRAEHEDGPQVLKELLKKASYFDNINKENGETLLDLPNRINKNALTGKNGSALGKNGAAPLHIAAINRSEGCVQLIKILLENGAEIDVPNRRHGERTPLQYAVFEANVKAVDVLIANNANSSKFNAWGESAISIARKNCDHNNNKRGKDATYILMKLMRLDINSCCPPVSEQNFSKALSSSPGLYQRPRGTTFVNQGNIAKSALSTSGGLSALIKVVGSVSSLFARVKSPAQEEMTHSYEPLTDSEAGVDPNKKPPSQSFLSRVFKPGVETSSTNKGLDKQVGENLDNSSNSRPHSAMEVISDVSPAIFSRPSTMGVVSDVSPAISRPSAMEVRSDLSEPLLPSNKESQR